MATLSDYYFGKPMDFNPLSQYYLGSGTGATRFNQNARPPTRFMSRGRGPESLYLNNMGVFAPTQMGDFTPSEGLTDTRQLRLLNQIVEDRVPQDNPNYRAMAASEDAAAQEAGAAPQRTLGLLGDMFGGASALDEYMTPEQRAQLQNQGVMAAAMQLLASSGPSRTPVGLGQALGEAYGAGQKGYTAAQQNMFTSMAAKQKMEDAKAAKNMQANVSNFLSQKAPEGVDANAFKAQQYMKLADVYAASNPEQASKYFDMAQKLMPAKEATPDDIKKLKALGLDVTLENLAKLNPSAAPQDPEGIRTLRALNLPVTLENLQSLKQEPSPAEVRLLQATNTPVTLENVMKIRQSGAGGGTTVSVNTGEKGFKNEFDLKKEFGSEPVYKEFQSMKTAFSQIQESLKKANPIGDVAAATKIMKLLDPGSVVRESELGIAMAATGKMDRLTNYVDMWKKGTLLTPTQRNEFNALATELFAASSKAYNDKRNEYAGFGAKYGIDANQALGAVVPVPQPMTQTPPAAGGAPVLTWDPVAKKFK